MLHLHVRTAFGERDLDARGAPGDECRESSLADSQQRLVHICRVDFALDDVEDADVATLFAGVGGHHAVLRLQQAPHDVEDGGFAHRFCGFDGGAREGRVGGHEEVAAGCWDEAGDDGDEVVVHVAWVAEGSGGGGHYR